MAAPGRCAATTPSMVAGLCRPLRRRGLWRLGSSVVSAPSGASCSVQSHFESTRWRRLWRGKGRLVQRTLCSLQFPIDRRTELPRIRRAGAAALAALETQMATGDAVERPIVVTVSDASDWDVVDAASPSRSAAAAADARYRNELEFRADSGPSPPVVRPRGPGEDHQPIETLQTRGLRQGLRLTKNQIVRAGLRELDAMTPGEFGEVVEQSKPVKPRRRSSSWNASRTPVPRSYTGHTAQVSRCRKVRAEGISGAPGRALRQAPYRIEPGDRRASARDPFGPRHTTTSRVHPEAIEADEDSVQILKSSPP